MEADKKKKQQDEWIKLYELDDDQLERLIENKFIRASEYHKSFKLCERQDNLA